MPEIALKDYIDAQFEALRRELKLQREADMRAIDLARETLGARLERMNEFRDQMTEERLMYVRIDTFKWTVGFIVSMIIAASTVVKFWR